MEASPKRSKKYVLVGGGQAGVSAAARIRRLDEQAQIVLYEKTKTLAQSPASLPYALSGQVPLEALSAHGPSFTKLFQVDLHLGQEVVSLDAEKKTLRIRDLASGEDFSDPYDILLLATGAHPRLPQGVSGLDQDHVHTLAKSEDGSHLLQAWSSQKAGQMLIFGASALALSSAEALAKLGWSVTWVVPGPSALSALDPDMASILHKEIRDQGLKLLLEKELLSINGPTATLRDGQVLPADQVLLALGSQAEVTLAKASGIQLGTSGAIAVGEDYQTNLSQVYALGDAIERMDRTTGKPSTKPLPAYFASKEARACADALFGRKPHRLLGLGSTATRFFDLNIAATGQNEEDLTKKGLVRGLNYDTVRVAPLDRMAGLAGASVLHLKVLFERPSGRLLGAQALGYGDVAKRIDAIAGLLGMGGNLEDLRDLEFTYSPEEAAEKDAVNLAGFVGCNLLEGDLKQVPMESLPSLLAKGAYVLDVRPARAFNQAHVRGAVNIPLVQLRDRLEEVPQDRTIFLHCRTGHTAYLASRILAGQGFLQVATIQGSMLAMSFYFADLAAQTGQASVLTGYDFR